MQPDPGARVGLEAAVAPSEDPEKVAGAVGRVTGGSAAPEFDRFGVRVVAEGPATLQKFHDQFRDRHVRGAARRLLLAGARGDSTTLMLNRQAATEGVIVLCAGPEESPLGPIYVTITCKGVEALIEWLTAYE